MNPGDRFYGFVGGVLDRSIGSVFLIYLFCARYLIIPGGSGWSGLSRRQASRSCVTRAVG